MIKPQLRLATIICLLCTTMASYAQRNDPYWALQVKAGTSLSNVYVGSDRNTTSDMKLGYQVGIYAEYVLPSDLYFEIGIILASKGAKYEQNRYGYSGIIEYHPGYATGNSLIDYENVSINAIYLQLPVYAGYKFDLNDKLSVHIAAGPYVSYGIGGKATIEQVGADGTTRDKKNVFGKDDWKRFDAGFSAVLGVEINKFSFNLGYDFGMIHIDRTYDVYNRNLFLNVGYRIL